MTEEVTAPEATQADPEVESRAREMGWSPKEEWRGAPEKWVDAETFVKKGETLLPIVKAANRKLEAKVEELTGILKDMTASQAKRERAAVEKAIAEREAKRDEAIEAGDVKAVKAIEKEIKELEEEKPEAPKKAAAAADPAITAWVEQNPWFGKDAKMRAFATELHGELLRDEPDLSITENLKRVRKEVEKRFPEKFENPKRTAPNAVEGGGSGGGGTAGGWDTLPDDVKAMGDRLIKAGVVKSRAEYAKQYLS